MCIRDRVCSSVLSVCWWVVGGLSVCWWVVGVLLVCYKICTTRCGQFETQKSPQRVLENISKMPNTHNVLWAFGSFEMFAKTRFGLFCVPNCPQCIRANNWSTKEAHNAFFAFFRLKIARRRCGSSKMPKTRFGIIFLPERVLGIYFARGEWALSLIHISEPTRPY